MRLFYQTLLIACLSVFIFTGTVQADCCNAGFSSLHLPQSSGMNTFEFRMDDSIAADIQFVQWAFGDGMYSSLRTPTHSYNYTGNYSVTLTVFKQLVNGVQKSCTETREISVQSACSNFIYFKSNRSVSFIQTAAFDIDSASSWAQSRNFLWTFGDGQTSNELNPTHTYAQEGYYTTCLYQYRNDSMFVDSCYVCQSFVIQDTVPPVTCNAAFSYNVAGSNVSVHAVDSLHSSYWWILGDTGKHHGNNASYTITSNARITICHRQYTGSLLDSSANYCENCTTIYSNIPIDTLGETCHSDFTYTLGDSSIALYTLDSAYISYWWLNVNGVNNGGIRYGGDTTMYIPSSGEIRVCHLQYNNQYGAVGNDSCIVCKVVRSVQDSIIVPPVPVCYSDFTFTVIGNTVSVHIDSVSYGRHLWNFAHESIRYDTTITSYTFNTSGTKRICQTTINTNYSTNITDSCTTCKDVLIESATISIHPNPAVHNVNIKVKDGLLSSISIFNVNGIEVKSIMDLNSEKCIVNIAALPSGIYYAIIVLTDGRITRSPIVIQ